MGDTLQLIRYAPLVKQRGGTVLLQCQGAFVPLLSSCPGIDRVIGRGEELPAFDVHASLLSLPAIMKTTLETIPSHVPYLAADQKLVDLWRERLAGVAGFRIGINWRGREGRGRFRERDVPLDLFAPLAALPGVKLISLKKDATREELAAARERFEIFDPRESPSVDAAHHPEAESTAAGSAHPAYLDAFLKAVGTAHPTGGDFDESHGAFMDSAAIMMNVDLVITSDTSVPHLAGALGVPVWTALPFVCDWRWMLDRNDSPWYPTMRLFRQKAHGDWAGVFEEIAAELSRLMAQQPGRQFRRG